MGEGGGWKNGVWADLRSGRIPELQFQGAGAHHRILERRNVLAREMYDRLVADGRFCGKQILAEVHWRLNALLSGIGHSVDQSVFGFNPADRYEWGNGKHEVSLFAQDTSLSGQFAQRWKLRTTAQEAASKEVANSQLRGLLA